MAAEHDDRPARHVLAGVVADSLDDRGRARVPHREALPGRAGAEELAARRAVEDRVPEQDRLAGVASRRRDDDAPAGHRLADVVVRLADEAELDAGREERAEALARRALEAGADAAGGRDAADRLRDGAAEARADRAVRVRDLVRGLDEPRAADRGLALGEEQRAEPVALVRDGLADVAGVPLPRPGEERPRSSESAAGSPVRLWRSRSVRPTASSSVRRPRRARSSRTSSATKRRYASTISGVPANFARSSGRWLAIPTGHVSRWHERTIRQPSARRSAVPNENSSAPEQRCDDDVAARS